jgi:hypothetical protein
LTLKAPDERERGKPMPIAVEGTADGQHRLFVYGEDPWEGGCATWPYQEQALKAVLTLTTAEGEPLDAGHFFKSFVVTPASDSAYTACAYLDTTPSGNPDVFEYGCYVIPATPTNNVNCYRSYLGWWVRASVEKTAREQVEKAQAERKQREESDRRMGEEAVARQAREEAERRQAIEETERKAREAKPKKCTVPQLRRHTLIGVRHLLRYADCRLGRVTTRRHGHGTLLVTSQNPQHGRTLPPEAAVSIVLGPRAG